MSVASTFERQMLDLINQERTSRGIDPLALELRLNEASEDHSVWMDDTGQFSHTGIGGSNPGDRMRDAGFTFDGAWTWGENIAFQSERGGPGIADDVIDLHTSLMNSPGHRANILNPDFEWIGIGIEVGDARGFDAVYVTQNFARTSAPVQADDGGGSTGTASDDLLVGDASDNQLSGGSGNDTMRAGGGQDTLTGGTGRDNLNAGAGQDLVSGGDGNDTISGGRGDDTLRGETGNDVIRGAAGQDRVYGDAGQDALCGGGGADVLMGGGGNDVLRAGAQNDRLNGGAGNDTLAGQAGADVFVFSTGRDVVTDFATSLAGERIDLRPTTSISSFNDLLTGGHLRQSEGNAIIDDLRGNTLELTGTAMAELQADDFVF